MRLYIDAEVAGFCGLTVWEPGACIVSALPSVECRPTPKHHVNYRNRLLKPFGDLHAHFSAVGSSRGLCDANKVSIRLGDLMAKVLSQMTARRRPHPWQVRRSRLGTADNNKADAVSPIHHVAGRDPE